MVIANLDLLIAELQLSDQDVVLAVECLDDACDLDALAGREHLLQFVGEAGTEIHV